MNGAATSPTEITRLLKEYSDGQAQSFDQAVAILYRELRSLARQQLRRSGMKQVHTTLLVHEAYEKLSSGQVQQLNDRRHFFAIAARAMRQIVVDSYRSEQAAKRGGGLHVVTLTENSLVDSSDPESIIAVDQAMQNLGSRDPELAEMVDLSCFGGLSNTEIAEMTETTVRTVQRKLKRAQTWLAYFMEQG